MASSSQDAAEVGQEEVQIRLVTQQQQHTVTDTAIAVPVGVRRSHLSQMVNHLLARDESTPFDFLVNSEFLRSTLSSHLDARGISREEIVEVEYVEAAPPPNPPTSYQHDDWVSSIAALGPSAILSGSYDGQVRIWSGMAEPVASFQGHQDAVTCVCSIPTLPEEQEDAVLLFASGSKDETLRVWTVDSSYDQKECLVFSAHTAAVNCLASQPTGRMICSGSWDRTIRIWAARPEEEDVTEVAVEDVGGSKRRRGQRKEKTVLRSLGTLVGSTGSVNAVCWPEEGVLYSSGEDHCLRTWDVASSRNTATLTGSQVSSGLSYSAATNLLASAEFDGMVRLFDPRSDKSVVMQTLVSHKLPVTSVSWSPAHPQQLVSGSLDGAGANLKLWDIRSSAVPMYNLGGHEGKVLACQWLMDTTIASGGSDGKLSVHSYGE